MPTEKVENKLKRVSRPTLARGSAAPRAGRLIPRKESAASTLFNRETSAFSIASHLSKSADDVRAKDREKNLRLSRDSDSSMPDFRGFRAQTLGKSV